MQSVDLTITFADQTGRQLSFHGPCDQAVRAVADFYGIPTENLPPAAIVHNAGQAARASNLLASELGATAVHEQQSMADPSSNPRTDSTPTPAITAGERLESLILATKTRSDLKRLYVNERNLFNELPELLELYRSHGTKLPEDS